MPPELKNLSKEALIQALRQQQQEIFYLKHQLENFKRLAFGQKRERFEGDPAQILLPFLIPEAAQQQLEKENVEKISYERKKAALSAHAGRQPLPDHLPVEEIEIHPDGDLTDMVCIGNEVTEELEYKPGSYFNRRFIRYKYAPKDKDGEGVLIAPCKPVQSERASPDRACWRKSWSINTSIIWHFTGKDSN